MEKYLIIFIIAIVFYTWLNCNKKRTVPVSEVKTEVEGFSNQQNVERITINAPKGNFGHTSLTINQDSGDKPSTVINQTGDFWGDNRGVVEINKNGPFSNGNAFIYKRDNTARFRIGQNGEVAIGGTSIHPNDYIKLGQNDSDYLWYNKQGNIGRIGGDINFASPVNVRSNLTVDGNLTVKGTLTSASGGAQTQTPAQLNDMEAIRTLAMAARDLQAGGLNVKGNLTVADKLNVNNGSEFRGGRHMFSDSENTNNKLRVGTAWNIAGIYSETGDVVVGSQSGKVKTHGTLEVGGIANLPGKLVVNSGIYQTGVAGHVFKNANGGDMMYLGPNGLEAGTIRGVNSIFTSDNLDLVSSVRSLLNRVSSLEANTIKNGEEIRMLHVSGFDKGARVHHNSIGTPVWAHGWTGGLTTTPDVNGNFRSGFRINRI